MRVSGICYLLWFARHLVMYIVYFLYTQLARLLKLAQWRRRLGTTFAGRYGGVDVVDACCDCDYVVSIRSVVVTVRAFVVAPVSRLRWPTDLWILKSYSDAYLVKLRSALAGMLLTALVISESALGRSLTLLIQKRSRKKVKWLP